MKKLITFILLLLLLTLPVNAQELARMSLPMVSGGGSAAAPAGGTWYYSNTTNSDTDSSDHSKYATGTPVTLGASGNVTAYAFKVYTIGTATTCKVALFNMEDYGDPLSSGTCSPIAGSWCIVTANYTASAAGTYRIIYECDGTLVTYAKNGDNIGVYWFGSYATFPEENTDWGNRTFAMSWITAICAGGDCGAPR